MDASSDVRTRNGPSLRIVSILLLLFFLVSTLLVPILLGPAFVDVLTGERPMSIFILVAVPGFTVCLGGMTLVLAFRLREIMMPTIFASDQFVLQGASYDWNCISELYVNHGETLAVFVFRHLVGHSRRAGLVIRKDRVDPSFEILVDLARRNGVQVDETRCFHANDLWSYRNKLLEQDATLSKD